MASSGVDEDEALRARPALMARGAERCWRRGHASASRRTARDQEVAGVLFEQRAWTGFRGRGMKAKMYARPAYADRGELELGGGRVPMS